MGIGKGTMEKPGRANVLSNPQQRGVKPAEEETALIRAEARKGKGPEQVERGAEGARRLGGCAEHGSPTPTPGPLEGQRGQSQPLNANLFCPHEAYDG